MSANNVLNSIDYSNEQFQGLKLAADWIRDLESSDSRIHKEKVIEKALMAAKLGSANAQCFLFNCYQAYNPFFRQRDFCFCPSRIGRTSWSWLLFLLWQPH